MLTRCILFVLALSPLSIALLKLAPPSREGYVGSAACERCHPDAYREWSESLHTQMMRPVDDPGVVTADFGLDDPDLRFDPDTAVWAIGGKWEQQFMGHDGETETLLPGVWLGALDAWDFKGWDGWEAPVPLRRCHGCHTVGLDPATGLWTERNIGCESCHGAGGWHSATLGIARIHSSLDAAVCGQCHVRGRSPSGEYYFPAGYRPGDVLEDYIVESKASPGQNNSAWWGNGFERSRHQEYSAWAQGGHALSLERLRTDYDDRYGPLTNDCLKCHSGDYVLSTSRKPTLASAQFGITCAVCHRSHGELSELRVQCDDCHVEGAFYHQPEKNAEHVACGASSGTGCVGCHMPIVAKIGGAFQLHSHRPGVVAPIDSERYSMPNSCQNGACHADESLAWALRSFEHHYAAR